MSDDTDLKALPKLLIVDDKPTNLRVLREILNELDVEILEATSGEETLSLVMRNTFVAILLDVNMPGMSGIETASLLRGHDNTMQIPVIFITGYDMDELDQIEGYAVGAADYIIKPIIPEILLSKVKMFLQLYLQAEEINNNYALLENINAERELQYKQTRRLLDVNPDCILVVNSMNTVVYANSAAERLFNKTAGQLEGEIFEFPITNGDTVEINLGDDHIVEMRVALIDWSGERDTMVMLHDISEFKLYEEKLLQLARHDQLTGLANRRYFLEYTSNALARARRRNGYLTVLFLDLDKFKPINDNLGHEMGDQLLKSVADRLRLCIREGDMAARLGGDEFVLILDDVSDPEAAQIIARKVLDVMGEPHELKDTPVKIGCSIGIASYPQHGDNPETLLKFADQAMYKIKSKGGNSF